MTLIFVGLVLAPPFAVVLARIYSKLVPTDITVNFDELDV